MKKITSLTNEYVKELVKLHDKKYRDDKRKFIIEGYNLISEAKEALETVLIVDEKDMVAGVENILVTEEIINKIAFTKTPQKIIGICNYLEDFKLTGERFLLLDQLQDPGNVGTLVRSALGFAIDLVIFSKGSVDIYNDKFIRATQGALFKIKIITGDLPEIILELKKQEVKIIGTSLSSSVSLEAITSEKKYALILGNEANGVSKELLELTDVNVKIAINPLLESLNVGVAGGIILHYLASKNQK
ncbi:MAG TPA: RNA methyltransferase [Bacilli bacterium]|nr:RNA methyltransferase [Bacilli bacterium]